MLLATTAAGPADAAFPGRNGWIAFDSVTMLAVDPDGSGLDILGSGYHPTYSRYGGMVAYGCGTDVQDSCRPGAGVRIKRADGRGRSRRLTTDRFDNWPDWSPSSKSIVFTRYPGGALTAAELWIYRGGRSRRLTPGEDAAWSVRGEIVFEYTDFGSDGPTGIYVIRPDGSGLRRVADGFQPEWSPRGHKIIYSTNACGYSCLYAVGRDGRGRRRLSRVNGFHPDYSPDGKRVVFSTHDEIVVMQANGRRRRVLFQGAQDTVVDSPDWQSLARRRRVRPDPCGASARLAC